MPAKRPTPIWIATAVALAAAHPACEAEDHLVELVAHPPEVRQWDRFEAAARLEHEPENPFDPDEIDLRAELVAPDGTRHEAIGFYYQPFQRALVGGGESLAAAGAPVWKIRFAPHRRGSWRFRLSVETPAGSGSTSWATLEVTAPRPSRHGVLRPGAPDHRYLCFDDGAPFFAVGENMAWYDRRGTYAYDDWLGKLAAQGGNYIRVWMPAWGFGLEEVERDAGGKLTAASLGDYSRRLGQAWQLDHVIERARELGVYVMLTIQHHGAFSETFNARWTDSPYNRANGGPLHRPEDFFTDDAARDLFKRRLRYLVARWGGSDALLAWELFNEVDLTEQRDRATLVDWHREMAREIRDHDPGRHMVTTSVTLLGEAFDIDHALFSLPEIDLVQFHRYGDMIGKADFTRVLPDLVATADGFGKPVLLSEVGADSRGVAETLQNDPEGIAFHDILWSGLFSRSAGTGMGWWWDEVVDPENWYVHFRPLATLVQDVTFHDEGFAPAGITASAPGRTLAAHGLAGRTTLLGWIKNTAHQWSTGGDATVIQGATVEISGIADGTWTTRWIDPYGETAHPQQKLTATGGAATLKVPSFARDIALRLRR